MTGHQESAEDVGALLAELAEREPAPEVSFDAVVRRGRRRRARRRIALAAGVAVAVAAVTAGIVAVLPDPGRDSAGPASGGPRPTGAASSAPPGSASASATPTTGGASAYDPLTPGPRVLVASGTDAKGHHWQVYARMWYPARTHDNAYRQNLAVWQDEGAVPNRKPTRSYTDLQPLGLDHVQTELWVDGVHTTAQGDFFDADSPGIAREHLTSVPKFEMNQLPVDAMSNSVCMGWNKSGSFPSVAATGVVRPDIAKVTVRWPDGSVEHPQLMTVGRSPDHFYAYTCHAGEVGTAAGYDAHGTELLRSPIRG